MNPHHVQPSTLGSMVTSLWGNRRLTVQMVRREVVGRYAGSFFGLQWSIVNPLLMLVVYTFVFSYVFNARWGNVGESRTDFAVILFSGMITHGFFAEVLVRSASLIVANVNYVKKVVFPLEILPVVAVGSALFHALISVGVLLVACLVLGRGIPLTALLLPIVVLPLTMLTLGCSWFVASVGVFVRDIVHVVGTLTTILLFVSPVFFPVSAVPGAFRHLMLLNPLTFIIEQVRNVLIWGQPPSWIGLGIYTLVALAVMWAGYAWFQKTRKGFADVL